MKNKLGINVVRATTPRAMVPKNPRIHERFAQLAAKHETEH